MSFTTKHIDGPIQYMVKAGVAFYSTNGRSWFEMDSANRVGFKVWQQEKQDAWCDTKEYMESGNSHTFEGE